MRTTSIRCLLVAVILLASCGTTATTVVTRQRLDKDAAGKLHTECDVHQTANTLMGTIDRRSLDINAVADAVARTLMAIPARPPAAVDARNFGS